MVPESRGSHLQRACSTSSNSMSSRCCSDKAVVCSKASPPSRSSWSAPGFSRGRTASRTCAIGSAAEVEAPKRGYDRCVGALDVQHLVHEYGCLLVFAAVALQALGLPVPGTTVLIAAAVYAAAENGLPIVGVVAAGGIGALAGTTAAFAVGRYGGERLLLRL